MNLFRYTIGDTSNLGFKLLECSLSTISNIFNDFDFLIQYNGSYEYTYNYLTQISKLNNRTKVIYQNRKFCPITVNDPLLGLWKICPPRIDVSKYEILCDNDIVFSYMPDCISKAIADNRNILCEDTVRYFGSLDHIHLQDQKWNSGFVGLSKNYDFKLEFIKTWKECGKINNISYAEEQALITKTLLKSNPIILTTKDIIELHKDTKFSFSNEKKENFHFVESNRNENHKSAFQFICLSISS